MTLNLLLKNRKTRWNMPNWCNNDITFTGDDLPKFKEWLSQGKFSFERIKPTPQDLLQGEGWYDWRVSNWSTKWDIDPASYTQSIKPNVIEFSFPTAWSPPLQVINALSKLFPALEITMLYSEQGAGFAGEATFFDGTYEDNQYSSGDDEYDDILERQGFEPEEEDEEE